MKKVEQVLEALKRHYGEGYAYPCIGCPYGGKGRTDDCRFELTRDALFVLTEYIGTCEALKERLEKKDEHIRKLHRTNHGTRFAYEPGELVYAPAKVFDRRSTHFDFKVIDEPERPVPARVVFCSWGCHQTLYEIRALGKDLKMQGQPVRIAPEHMINAETAVMNWARDRKTPKGELQ